MGIKKEFVCFAHGPFEADSPTCPHGCTTAIEREFRTPVGVKSPRTRNIDRTLSALAKDFGYTDLSNRSGSVAGSSGRPAPQGPDFRPVWGQVPKGDRFKQGGAIEHVEGSQGGAASAAGAHRVHDAESAHAGFQEVASMMGQPRPQVDPKLVYGDRSTLIEAVQKS